MACEPERPSNASVVLAATGTCRCHKAIASPAGHSVLLTADDLDLRRGTENVRGAGRQL